MSYSVDLWNSFNKIGDLLLSNLKGSKNLIEIFNNLYLSIKGFSDNIKELYENYDYEISTHKTLYDAVLYFKEDLLNLNNHLIDFLFGIKNEIIKPLGNIHSTFLNKYLAYKNGINQLEEEYEENVKILNNSKNNFYKSVRDVEDCKINFEYKKQNVNDLSAEYKKKEEEKIIELLQVAKESQKKYVFNINRINEIQSEYIEKKKNYLNNMQYMEEQLGECIKDSLRKLILYQLSFIRNVQYDSEVTSKKYEEIDINKDIKYFIKQHSTNDLIPFKYEFIPYSSSIGKRYKNISDNSIKEIRSFIRTIFNNDSEIQNISFMSNNKRSMNIKDMADYIYRINDNKYADKESYYTEKINNSLRNKRERKALLNEINKIRIKGSYFINDFNFNNIGSFLKLCINVIVNENKKESIDDDENDKNDFDYESMNLIFIIATNLYKINEYGNKPRIFLQENLVGTPIFSDFIFWKNIIRYFIISELHNQKKYNIYDTNINKEIEKQKLIKNKINTFIFHMKAFEVKNKLINEIIYFFIKYYVLDSKLVEPLLIKDENIKDKESDDSYFILDKESDNNFVVNIPNNSYNSLSSINMKINNEE